MTKNTILSLEELSDDDTRLLEDGVFPHVFGKLNGTSEVVPAELDLLADLLEFEGDTTAVQRRISLCQDLNRWHQAIGTPAGFYLLQALSAQSKLLQNCCLRIVTHYPKFTMRVPLYPWLKSNLREWTTKVKQESHDAAPLEVLVKSLRTWLNLDKGIGVISGESPLRFRAARTGLVLLDKWLGGTEEFALSLHQGGDPEDSACPLISGLALGTNALSLSAGLAASLLYLYRLQDTADKEGIKFDGSQLCRGSTFEHYALGHFDTMLLAGKVESEFQLLTYLAASDLAQFTPLHPIFTQLRTSQRWNDLHPGYRLSRALDFIEEKGLRLEGVMAQDYFKFTSAICKAFGWPEVPRFLDAVRDPDSWSGEEHPSQHLFKTACIARETNPCAFFDPFEAVKHLSQLTPPGSQLSEVETSRDTDQALEFALEAELFAAGFQLFFSPKKPDFVCRDYAETVGLLHDPDEMIKTYFGLEYE